MISRLTQLPNFAALIVAAAFSWQYQFIYAGAIRYHLCIILAFKVPAFVEAGSAKITLKLHLYNGREGPPLYWAKSQGEVARLRSYEAKRRSYDVKSRS